MTVPFDSHVSSRGRARSQAARMTIVTLLVSTVAVALPIATGSVHAASLQVDSAADVLASDGQCTLREAIINANSDSTDGSTDCAAGSGADTITFGIPASGVVTITPSTPLPAITSALTIDGYSQAGSSANTLAVGSDATLQIELSGAALSGTAIGLDLTVSTGSVVRGLAVNHFGSGTAIKAGPGSIVEGNFIGTNAAGTTAVGNFTGVSLNGVSSALVGGPTPAARNVISGNTYGVLLGNGATGNTVSGNYIGTNAAGTAAVANIEGIYANSAAALNTIGGLGFGAGNVLSGNLGYAILLDGVNVNGTQILGNLIGTNSSGTAAVANSNGIFTGASSGSADGTVIGDGTAAGRNVISGNVYEGIALWQNTSNTSIRGNYIGVAADGVTPLGNQTIGGPPQSYGAIVIRNFASNNTVGGNNPGDGNIIANNAEGITTFSGTRNRFVGNSIFANSDRGIWVSGADVNDPGDVDGNGLDANNLQNFPVISSTIVGGNPFVSGNLVVNASIDSAVGFSAYPIQLDFYEADSAASGQGKVFLGRTLAAAPGSVSAPIGNAAALHVSLGDPLVATATDANGNTSNFSAVSITVPGVPVNAFTVNSTSDSVDATPGDNRCETVFGNNICTLRAAIAESNANPGTDTIRFSIAGAGVKTITPATTLPFITQSVTIDGTTQPGSSCASWPPTLNVVLDAHNLSDGLDVTSGALTLRGMVVNGYNQTGVFTNSTGNRFECNFIGTNASGTAAVGFVALNGLWLAGSVNIVGGSSVDKRNLISGNDNEHIRITSGFNTVQGNYLGTDVTGVSALGNFVEAGVAIFSGINNLIGGTTAGAGNRIANSLNGGTGVIDTSGTGNSIRGNSIDGNSELGIDLGGNGVTFNHLGVIAGPNRFQNYPVVSYATFGNTGTRVVGTIDGVAGRDYEVDVFANSQCDATSFGEGSQFLGTFTTTADPNGVATFDNTVPGGLGEPFGITTTATDAVTRDTSEFSYCRPASTTNLTWATAQPVTTGATQFITDRLQEKWFKFAVQPGDKVHVKLTGLPGGAVSLHRDPNPIYNGLINPTSAAALSAEAADTAFLPSGSLPSGSLPSGSLPSGSLPSGSLPSGSLETGFLPSGSLPSGSLPSGSLPSGSLPSGSLPSGSLPSGSLPSGSLPSGSLPSGSLPSGSLPSGSLDAYASAARRSLLGISMNPYSTVQTIDRNTYDLQENLYVRVVGPVDLSTPFQLEVTVDGGICSVVRSIPDNVPTISGAQPTNDGRATLIVTDSTRLRGTPDQRFTAVADLRTLAGRTDVNGGGVIDLADPSFQRVAAANVQADLNAGCPGAKNIVATEIKRLLDVYRAANTVGGATTLKYVVLAGGANVIPFYQVQDVAGLANEKEYVPPVGPNTPTESSLRSGLVQGQDFYGSKLDLTIGSRSLAVPDLAVGRLVDTASDVTAAVNNYIATNGVVTPHSSLVTGYDFVGDAAASIATEMNAGTNAAPDTLIQAPGQAPNAPTAWTADQLRTKLFAGNHDVLMLSGHFSAGSLVAADYRTTLTPAEVAQSTVNLSNAIVIALGCHGGFGIPSSDLLNGASPDPDWIKAFVRKGSAGFIAATGYAYGDTELTEYGERLVVGLSRQMRTGNGPISLGQALVAAKRDYLASTAQITGIDEKTIVEMTLYGLPMMKVNMPGARITPPGNTSIITATTPVPDGPGAGLGLSSATTPLNPTLTAKVVPLQNLFAGGTVSTTYYVGRDGQVANPFEPILPKQIDDVSVTGRVLRGVALRGGTYTDVDGITPLTSAPTTETSTAHGSFNTDVFYPNQVWMPNFYDAVSGGSTRLVTVPAQFRSSAPGATDGTVRTFSNLDLSFYYLSDNWTAPGSSSTVKAAAVSAAPNIYGVSAAASGSAVNFRVNAQTDGSAGMQAVWVLYTGIAGSPFHGRWAPVDLVRDVADETLWTGTLNLGTASPDGVRFMVQAVNGAGLTALSTNLGAYYPVAATTATPPPPAASTIAFVSPPTTGAYLTASSFAAHLASGGSPISGRQVVFDVGGQQAQAVTNANGDASVSIKPLVAPGSYTAQVTFAGGLDYRSAAAATPFTVVKDLTSVTVTPAATSAEAGQPYTIVARVRDSGGRALGGKSLVFVITGNGQTVVRSVIADNWGDATLGDVGMPAGTYVVDTYFGGTIPVGPGQTIQLSDDNYNNSQLLGSSLTLTDHAVPTISATATNADSSTYTAETFTKQNVTVSFTCSDGARGSGIHSCTPPQTVTFEGVTAVVLGTAVDNGGLTATVGFGPIKIDRTGPTITVTSPAAGATYAVGASLVASYACTDAGAGVATCAGPVASGQSISTATAGVKTFTVNATDALGNASTKLVTYTVLANAAPVVRADLGVAGLEDVGFQTNAVALSGSFTDADGPGPYAATVRWTATGAFTPLVLNNGSQFVAAFIYSSAGTQTVTVKICDAGGHCGTDDITVRSGVTQKITPVRECVVDRGASVSPRYQARFGYNNPASFAIVVPSLPLVENTFTAAPTLRGQPQIFLPGNKRNVFTVTFASGTIGWKLNNTTVTALATSPRC